MGRSILKSHAVDRVRYLPDGYFGIERPEDHLVLPVEDSAILEQFRKVFRLQRTNEPGLSLVVPWYCHEEITPRSLLESILRGYFYPILAGDLEVEIETPGARSLLNLETLLQRVRGLGPDLAWMIPLIELAIWGRQTVATGESLVLGRPEPIGALRWTPEMNLPGHRRDNQPPTGGG